MKVVTWNVQHQGLATRRHRVVDALREHHPDLVLLQEVSAAAHDGVLQSLVDLQLPDAHSPMDTGISEHAPLWTRIRLPGAS